MRVLFSVLLMMALLVTTGCGLRAKPTLGGEPAGAGEAEAGPLPCVDCGEPADPASSGEAVAGSEEPVPADWLALGSPAKRSADQLADWLRQVAALSGGSVRERLERLYAHYGLRPPAGKLLVAERDLDGDGTLETVTALNGSTPGVTGHGALFVLYSRGGTYQVDQSEYLPGVVLETLLDVDGNGRPEMIWSSSDHGAHTAYSTVFASRWSPGRLEPLPGEPMYITFMEFRTEGRDLLLSGGLVGSAGAGEAQRAYTDRYRWADGAIRRVDRRYAPSEYAYHRLQDGIVAEEYGRMEDARAAYQQAMEPGRTPLKEGLVPAEMAAQFGEAVRAFARFRLERLALSSRQDDCQAGAEWASSHPTFLEALNSPYGYANPHWGPDTLCGPLPSP